MRVLLSSIFILFSYLLAAQDFHYSMYQYSPLLINSSLAGVYESTHQQKDFRFVTHYRQQWRSIPSGYLTTVTPFTTGSISLDHRLRIPKLLRRDALAIGGSWYQDKTGDLNFSTQQIGLALAYHKALNRTQYQYISVGVQPSLVRRSIDYTNSFFDNQWSGKDFDPTLSSGENFTRNQFYYTDWAAGLSFYHQPEQRAHYTIGLSAHHLTKPSQSFFENSDRIVTLYRKWIIHAEARYELAKEWYVLPQLMYMRQGSASESNVGAYFQKVLGASSSCKIGAIYRIVGSHRKAIAGDALVVAYLFSYKKFDIGFSYDTNTSPLSEASRYRGAFEIVFIYHEKLRRINSKYKRFKEYIPDCPDHHYEN